MTPWAARRAFTCGGAGTKLDHSGAIALMRQVSAQGAAYEGDMPGKSAVECGNYRNLDLALAKKLCADYGEILEDWTEEKLRY